VYRLPVNAPGTGYIVTDFVVKQPVVGLVRLMVAVPEATPVIIPPAGSTSAVPGSDVVHAKPVLALVNVIVAPGHTP
jgi:hypothetical protein